MAANELGRYPILDLTFQNFGATAIAAGLVVLVDAAHVPSATAIGGVLLPTAAGGVVGTLGVPLPRPADQPMDPASVADVVARLASVPAEPEVGPDVGGESGGA